MRNVDIALTALQVRLDLPIAVLLAKKDTVLHVVQGEESVHRTISLMSEHQIGCAMVMNGEKLVGLVSERDYARKIILMGRSSLGTRAKDIMTAAVATVTPASTLAESMELIQLHRVRHLPVLDGDRLVGVISIGDLLNHVLTSQQETIQKLQDTIATQETA